MADIQITPASAWRRDYEDGIAVTMPHNGRTIRVRSVSVQYMVTMGRLPDSLTSLALGEIGVTGEQGTLSVDTLKQVGEFNQVIVTEALLEPRIVEDPQSDDEIAYHWLSPEDVDFIVEVVQQPVEQMRRFHPESVNSVEPVPAGEADKSRTKRGAKAS